MNNEYTCAMDRMQAARLSASLMAMSDLAFAEALATVAAAFGSTKIHALLDEAMRRIRPAPDAEKGREVVKDTGDLLKKIVETVAVGPESSVEYENGFFDGYAAAIVDICAGLRTKRTAGGETISGAVHAAEVIERGDFVGFADKQAAEKGGET